MLFFLGQVGAAVLIVLLLAVLADQAQRMEVPVVGPPHDVTGEGDGVEEDWHRDGGDLGVAVVQLPPHVRHAPVPAAGLEQQQHQVEVKVVLAPLQVDGGAVVADGSEGVDGPELLCGGLDGADGVGQNPGAALSSQLVLLCGT